MAHDHPNRRQSYEILSLDHVSSSSDGLFRLRSWAKLNGFLTRNHVAASAVNIRIKEAVGVARVMTQFIEVEASMRLYFSHFRGTGLAYLQTPRLLSLITPYVSKHGLWEDTVFSISWQAELWGRTGVRSMS